MLSLYTQAGPLQERLHGTSPADSFPSSTSVRKSPGLSTDTVIRAKLRWGSQTTETPLVHTTRLPSTPKALQPVLATVLPHPIGQLAAYASLEALYPVANASLVVDDS